MTKRIVILGFDAGPMTAAESALDDLEASWADFAYAIRPGLARVVRRPGAPGIQMAPLGTVRNVLENYREKTAGGDRSAIFDALTHCAEENVPMPYWLSTAIIGIARELHQPAASRAKPRSLHTLFGMDARLPTSDTKALKARRDLQLRAQLWFATKRIQTADGCSVDAALKKARAELRFPYEQRKSRQMFDLQDRIQSDYIDGLEGKKRGRITHRIKK